MTTPIQFPGPRDGLDEGSLAELAQDGREIAVDVGQPRPWVTPAAGQIYVPERAPALIDGLPGYGV